MSDLLKQAIADAKAVRATALSNAKAALEEQFAPKLQSMLSEKLKADLAAEEAGAGEEEAPLAAPEGGEEALPVADVNVNVDEPAPEAAPMAPEGEPVEAPVGSENPEAPIDGQAPVQDPAAAPAEEAPLPPDDEEVDEDAIRGTISAELDPTMRKGEFTEGLEKASPDYKKTTSGHKTEDPGKQMVKPVGAAISNTKGGPKEAGENRTASSNYKTMPKGNEVKNIKSSGTEDPQGPSKELADGPSKTDTTGTAALKENEEVDDASLDEILRELENSVNEVGMEEEGAGCETQAPVAGQPSGDEEIDLNELLSEDEDEEKKEKEDKKEKKDDEDDGDEKKKNLPPWLQKENISLKKELTEYRNAVVYLRDRINEVNLLNAKLLYTNKLFKQTSLTNEQKLKVIESFDLTKSIREAKLVYATLAESFNFGAKKTAQAPAAKKQVSGTVRSITEGLASKPVASTKPTKPVILTEGQEMANRFKKLAGITGK
jgi:hypothetical protein